MKLIGYTYDADYHCVACTTRQFGAKLDHPQLVGKALDSEGNEVHPLFDTDEWWANDTFEGNSFATLNCSECGYEMSTYKGER